MYKNELPFLNIIRGSSALLVLFYHFFIFFFTAQPFSASLINAAPLYLVDPFYLSYIEAMPFSLGHLGVAFFFLMSGFFIQPSLEKYNFIRPFLVHKFLRLWPTYAFCFGLGLVFVYFFSLLRDDIYPYSFDHVFSYFFWTRDIFAYPYIDGAVWSLEIQVKYYIFAAFIWYFWRHKFLEAMTVSLLLLCGVGFGMSYGGLFEDSSYEYLINVFNKDIKYFLLITIGLCFYHYYKKKHSILKLIIFGLLLLGFFASPLSYPTRSMLMNSYYLGLVFFAYSIVFKNIGQKSSGYVGKAMDWVAKISYPLYIGHVLPGYTIMYYLLEKGVDVYLAIFAALVVVFPIAYFAHEKIEKVFAGIRTESPQLGR